MKVNDFCLFKMKIIEYIIILDLISINLFYIITKSVEKQFMRYRMGQFKKKS